MALRLKVSMSGLHVLFTLKIASYSHPCLCVAKDYCVDKDDKDNTPRPDDNIFLNRKVRNCTPDTPCDRCEGDCDTHADCKGDLKCFQKDGPGEVDGCIGRETSKTDFCYLP